MSEATRLASTLYVGGLAPEVTLQTLTAAFIPFGEISDITLPKQDAPNSVEPHRGFAYVEFEQPEDAAEALDNMDQSELFGRIIKVAKAKAQREVGEGLGSKVAVWEQEGYLKQYEVSEEDKKVADEARKQADTRPLDPMEALEGLDVAGPRPE